jgi:hypothetical protein
MVSIRSAQDATKDILKMFIRNNMAFRCIDNKETRTILEKAYHGVSLPERHTLSMKLGEYASEERTRMLDEVRRADAIVLAVDLWKANNDKDFLTVLASYVDEDWKHRCRLIGFEHVTTCHKGEMLKDILDRVCNEADIEPTEQVAGIVSDSGPDIRKAVKLWQEQEYGDQTRHVKRLRFEKGFYMVNLPCLAHVVHNATKKAFKDADGLEELLSDFKDFISWVRKSSNNSRLLKEAQEDAGVTQPLVALLDNETRWHSTLVSRRHILMNNAVLLT